MLIKNGFFSKTSTKNSFISIVKIILQAENTEKYGLSIYYTYFFTLKNIGACMLYYVIIYTFLCNIITDYLFFYFIFVVFNFYVVWFTYTNV